MNLSAVCTLAQKEVRDAWRNRWFALYVVAFTALALALSALGLAGAGSLGLSGFGRTTASLINLVLLIVPLTGLALGALSLAGERERGLLLTVMAQPLGCGEVLAGKALGLAAALLASLALGFGFSGGLVAVRGGGQGAVFGHLLLLSFALAVVCLSIGLLVSSLSSRSATAVGAALFLWMALVFFGDLGLMGAAVVARIPAGALFSLSLANPLQVFKTAAILQVAGGLDVLGPAGVHAMRVFGPRLPLLLWCILAAWMAAPLSLAHLALCRRGAV